MKKGSTPEAPSRRAFANDPRLISWARSHGFRGTTASGAHAWARREPERIELLLAHLASAPPSAKDLEVLRDLRDAVSRWESAQEWDVRFPGERATRAIVEAHAHMKAHYARLSADFRRQHPALEEQYPRLLDDAKSYSCDLFCREVHALHERLG